MLSYSGPGWNQANRVLNSTALTISLHTHTTLKCKRSPYSITERRVLELIPIVGSQPAGYGSHKPGGRLPLLSARPAVTPATLKRAATNFAAWWTEAQWVWTVCLKLLPDSVTPRSFPQAGCPSCCPINSIKALKTTSKSSQQSVKCCKPRRCGLEHRPTDTKKQSMSTCMMSFENRDRGSLCGSRSAPLLHDAAFSLRRSRPGKLVWFYTTQTTEDYCCTFSRNSTQRHHWTRTTQSK